MSKFTARCEPFSYLDPGLGEPDPHGELLPHEDVWVVSLPETSLKLVQLARAEPEWRHTENRFTPAD